MRLWTLHPKHLDARGLVALWREALLAQAVLRGKTIGYRNHPQLTRFRETARPVAAIADYLRTVQEEAVDRGYKFDRSRISSARTSGQILVSSGQVEYEWRHLRKKLTARDPSWLKRLRRQHLDVHPLFVVIEGPVEKWEKPASL
jgi:hypothetical protein